ncbi:hypothetical protein, partial [Chitinophaga sp.]|uniref:hypothetical protein n=1 Tax=Chitinophaga sp. TaxID=1869181 RepID=UPI002C72850B
IIVCNFRAHKPVNHCPTGLWAGNLHKTFQELTASYTLDVNEGYRQLLKLQTIATYNQLTQESTQKRDGLEQQIQRNRQKDKSTERSPCDGREGPGDV